MKIFIVIYLKSNIVLKSEESTQEQAVFTLNSVNLKCEYQRCTCVRSVHIDPGGILFTIESW